MTIHDPQALLQNLVNEQNECTWLEFKENNDDPEMIGRTISALANSAILNGEQRAFLVFGVSDEPRQLVGTSVRLQTKKQGNQDFLQWLLQLLQPKVHLEIKDFEFQELNFSIMEVHPAFSRPVSFSGTEYIRINSATKNLKEFPEYERKIWLITSGKKFEQTIAAVNITPERTLELLDTSILFSSPQSPAPERQIEITHRLISDGFIIDNKEGRFDITNLGAFMLARNMSDFELSASKMVRVIGYKGRDKSEALFEHEFKRGYASGFAELLKYVLEKLPTREIYLNGIRKEVDIYPRLAIRELIANALIHQDFMLDGSAPVVEIFENRIEISNPGASLVDPHRMIDDRRSRNEKLARAMRTLGLCEERGGGLDKTITAIESAHLPAPELISSGNAMRVVLLGPKTFSEMTKAERVWACYCHCTVRFLARDAMSNTSLRERFQLEKEDYQAVSTTIRDAIDSKMIAPADPEQGKRNAKYVPYFAAPS
jgi:ATP-dependent DNA helicase RecG